MKRIYITKICFTNGCKQFLNFITDSNDTLMKYYEVSSLISICNSESFLIGNFFKIPFINYQIKSKI